MNSLSWFLYFADCFSKTSYALVVIGIIGSILGMMVCVYFSIEEDEHSFWKWMGVPLFCLFLSCLIPSKETMYAIAASEIGEEVIKSPVGQKSLKALEQWIDKQLEEKK